MDAQHLIIVEVVLHHSAVLCRNLAEQRVAQAVEHAAFHLRLDAVGVDGHPAVDGAVHLVDDQLVVFIERHIDDDGHVGQEAAVRRDAEAAPFRHVAAFAVPAGLAGHALDHRAQPARVGRILRQHLLFLSADEHRLPVDREEVVIEAHHPLRLQLGVGETVALADQLEQIVLRVVVVASGRPAHLVRE